MDPLVIALGSVEAEKLHGIGPKANAVGVPGHESGKVLYSRDDGTEVGVWECTVGRWHTCISQDEFCHILKGHWRLTLPEGEIIDLKAGDSLFMPAGFEAESEALETIRKVYSIGRT